MSVLYCLTGLYGTVSASGGGTCVLQSSKFNGPRTVALARRARRDLVHDGLAATRYLGVWSVTECTRAAGLQNIDRGVFSCAQKKRLSPRLSDARPTQFPPPPPTQLRPPPGLYSTRSPSSSTQTVRIRWDGCGAAAALVTTRRGGRVPMAARVPNEIRRIVRLGSEDLRRCRHPNPLSLWHQNDARAPGRGSNIRRTRH